MKRGKEKIVSKKVAKGPKITSFWVINSHWFQNEKSENITYFKAC